MSPTTAAIVLAGGRSTRMGREKATLEWHGSTLLRRAAGIVQRAVDGPVVVVHAAGQTLPALMPDVELATDELEARGPLQGIAAGLQALGGRAEVVFVTGVDAPLLHPALVAHVIASLHPDDDVALPEAHGFPHPLAAAYRAATIAPLVAGQLQRDELGTRPLFARCRVRRLDEGALLAEPSVAERDPQLHSLTNLNTPRQYAAARAQPPPLVTVAGRGSVRAATLGAAGDGPALIDGRFASDPDEPLVTGDDVRFVSRDRG